MAPVWRFALLRAPQFQSPRAVIPRLPRAYRPGIFAHRIALCNVCRSFASSSGRGDPYNILGIERNASADEIKSAYRIQALKWHPDRHLADKDKRSEAEERFSAAANAYEILSDPQKRQQYDMGDRGPFEFGPGGFPGSGFQGGFPSGGMHSAESAERLFRELFGDQALNQVFRGLFEQLQSNMLQVGMEVRVLPDVGKVLAYCRESGIDTTDDGLRTRALKRRGQIINVDPQDRSVKVRIEDVGDVWFGMLAVRPMRPVRPVQGAGSPRGGGGLSQGPPGFKGVGGAGGSTVQVRQEIVAHRDGRRVVRVTRVVRQPDGSSHEEVTETPISDFS